MRNYSLFRASIWRDPILAGLFSSLLAAGLIALIGEFIRRPWPTVPVWTLMIPLVFLVIALLAFYQLLGQRVAMTLGALRKNHWYSDVLQLILVELASRKVDVIVKVPQRDFSMADQDDSFDDIITNRHHYAASIVASVEPQLTSHDISTFVRKFAKPVLFLDVQPFDSEEDYLPQTAFLGYDNEKGGEFAAEAMCHFLSKGANQKPKILVIGGTFQTGRQTGFQKTLHKLMPEAEVTLRDDGHFARDEARKVVREYIEEDHHWPFAGVFCTNDEMALGAVDMLLTLSKEQVDGINLIGYDGLDETLITIARGGTPLRNTVVQDPDHLAEEAVRTLLKLMKKEEVPKINKLTPHLYRHVST